MHNDEEQNMPNAGKEKVKDTAAKASGTKATNKATESRSESGKRGGKGGTVLGHINDDAEKTSN